MSELRYGDDRTIHRTGYVDVEVDCEGTVVAVWFRCHPVPFRQADVAGNRADEMRRMYRESPELPTIKAIVFAEDA